MYVKIASRKQWQKKLKSMQQTFNIWTFLLRLIFQDFINVDMCVESKIYHIQFKEFCYTSPVACTPWMYLFSRILHLYKIKSSITSHRLINLQSSGRSWDCCQHCATFVCTKEMPFYVNVHCFTQSYAHRGSRSLKGRCSLKIIKSSCIPNLWKKSLFLIKKIELKFG